MKPAEEPRTWAQILHGNNLPPEQVLLKKHLEKETEPLEGKWLASKDMRLTIGKG